MHLLARTPHEYSVVLSSLLLSLVFRILLPARPWQSDNAMRTCTALRTRISSDFF